MRKFKLAGGTALIKLLKEMKKVKKILRSRKGFTMVELIATLAITAIFFTMITILFATVMNTYASSIKLSDSIIANKTILTAVKQELPFATDIKISEDAKSIEYTSQTYGMGCSLGIMREGMPDWSEQTNGVPVIFTSTGVVPLMFREHVNKNIVAFKFSLNGNVLTLDIDNGSAHTSVSMGLINMPEEVSHD